MEVVVRAVVGVEAAEIAILSLMVLVVGVEVVKVRVDEVDLR